MRAFEEASGLRRRAIRRLPPAGIADEADGEALAPKVCWLYQQEV